MIFVEIAVRRKCLEFKLNLQRTAPAAQSTLETHDVPGPAFRQLQEVADLKLSLINAAECGHDIEEAKSTKGLMVDVVFMRSSFCENGPQLSVGLCGLCAGVSSGRPGNGICAIYRRDLDNPGAFHCGPGESLTPSHPHYAGKIVILVDESSISQAEYTAMAFRSAPRAIVVGSTTAGADGNDRHFHCRELWEP